MPTTPVSRRPTARASQRSVRAVLRVALSLYVTNGLSCAFGLLLISSLVNVCLGVTAGTAAGVGVIVCTPPDLAAPRRGKLFQILPAVLAGIPLFFAVQALHAAPIRLGLLLVPATFVAFLVAAWGKRGLPVAVSAMFAMVFSMAVPVQAGWHSVVDSSVHFALGAGLYLVYAQVANALLNMRYRTQILADTLLVLADLIRIQAQQFRPAQADEATQRTPLIGRLLQQQAAFADHLQSARDLLLEAPRTARRQQLAGMLMQVLEMRDHLLASELDLEELRRFAGHEAILLGIHDLLQALADINGALADALLIGRKPEPAADHHAVLARLHELASQCLEQGESVGSSGTALAHGLIRRIGNIHDETRQLVALARGETAPNLALVQATWRMFVSPTDWSWQPLRSLWQWDAPPLRHALRAALAIATAYAVSLWLPWGSHDYWILLTIVVVLRGSLSQTLERRNSRVAGTALGCLIAGLLLHAGLPHPVLLLVITVAQATAHAFTARRYLVTAVAATVLALVQAHLLNADGSAGFAIAERLGDTLLGVAIAWAFAYVLPSWERQLIPQLVARTLNAQARHARMALALIGHGQGDAAPELAWRLARRETYDSLSALVQATQRSLSEPRAVRPPLAALGHLLAHGYQLLAQLTAVKTMLMLRRNQLDVSTLEGALRHSAAALEQILHGTPDFSRCQATPGPEARPGQIIDDNAQEDLSPRLLRRLELAEDLALRLRRDAERVLSAPAGS
ncbi:MAG: FUSC family protein [Pseudomonadota bacterium]|nr:FUSC family protein [Pseudomonadota bacterium]